MTFTHRCWTWANASQPSRRRFPRRFPIFTPIRSAPILEIALAETTARLKIGLAWAGRATHRNDRNRSLHPDALAPLAQIPDIAWISLQKGKAAEPIRTGSQPIHLLDFTSELNDFADTAAAIDNLDPGHLDRLRRRRISQGRWESLTWVLLPFAFPTGDGC